MPKGIVVSFCYNSHGTGICIEAIAGCLPVVRIPDVLPVPVCFRRPKQAMRKPRKLCSAPLKGAPKGSLVLVAKIDKQKLKALRNALEQTMDIEDPALGERRAKRPLPSREDNSKDA